MRNYIVMSACLIGLLSAVVTDARAESWRRPVQGGLIGGVAGALISRSSEIDSRVAIPALAATGILIGYGHERGWYNRSRSHRRYFTHGWPYYPYAYTAAGYPYGYGRPVYYRDSRRGRAVAEPRAVSRSRREPVQRQAQQGSADRHPGVAVEPVDVTLSNGVSISVRLVKLHDRYIGPRGETYDELPSADTVLRRMEARD